MPTHSTALRSTGLLLVLCLAAGCQSTPSKSGGGGGGEVHSEFPASRQTSQGKYFVTYLPNPLPVRVNEPFSLDVRVFRDAALSKPAYGVQVKVDAEMPAHHHGMTLTPAIRRTGDGAFLVTGMLLHMPGDWELLVDVIEDGKSQRARFELHL